ncbi:MAG: WbqC family protein [Prevotellaceae bacterium]|jgi:hypothetical protein|nr:WbqC family protein [Prevotellaceae bacterium]
MHTIYLSSAYLAPIQYYCKLLEYDRIYIDPYEHYQKQTYRNRCVIAAPDGPLALTVPIVKPHTPKCMMRDIRISDHGNWRHLHWNALISAYSHTPFFQYYMDELHEFYEHKYVFLLDFNEALLFHICEQMDIKPNVSLTNSYRTFFDEGEEDWRNAIRPKQASDAKHLSQSEQTTDFMSRPYYQVFQEKLGFLPNLSIVDLLFNLGPESLLYLTTQPVAK